MKYLFILLLTLIGCAEKSKVSNDFLKVKSPEKSSTAFPSVEMTKDRLYDKVLGALVGSAIGDAMGAPTEMWSRADMQLHYGHIDKLDDMVREPSPEGTWDYNMQGGSTTDDTRWKALAAKYYTNQANYYRGNASSFADFLVGAYQDELDAMKEVEAFDPEPLEAQMRRVSWLQEWAKIAKPFSENDLQAYTSAVNKFYGGEMACGGMLYAPILGLTYPGAPFEAYDKGYDLAIFDIGFAKDITGLTTAMVAQAMSTEMNPKAIVEVHRSIDPQGYFKSRLLGRVTYGIYQTALSIADQVHAMHAQEEPISAEQYAIQVTEAYRLLDQRNQDVPFHAGEIHLINLTALLVTDFDFQKAMEFVINYGRDNDTVAAITGSILGALHGFRKLPSQMAQQVLHVNRENLSIDLEQIASAMVDKLIAEGVVGLEE